MGLSKCDLLSPFHMVNAISSIKLYIFKLFLIASYQIFFDLPFHLMAILTLSFSLLRLVLVFYICAQYHLVTPRLSLICTFCDPIFSCLTTHPPILHPHLNRTHPFDIFYLCSTHRTVKHNWFYSCSIIFPVNLLGIPQSHDTSNTIYNGKNKIGKFLEIHYCLALQKLHEKVSRLL